MTAFIPEFIATRKSIAEAGGKTLRFRRPTRALIPKGIERQYRSDLFKIISALRQLIIEQLIPELPRIVAEAQLRQDSARQDDFVDILESIMGPIGVRLDATVATRAEGLVQRYFNATNNHSKGQLLRQLKSALRVDAFPSEHQLGSLLKSFRSENISLIKDLTTRTLDGVSETVQRMVRAGDRPNAIAAEIRDKFKLSKNRAAAIARDQVSKLNGQLSRMRQTNLGIEEYIWRTSRDERVRARHLDREGQRFSWDNPPFGGHPGQEPFCRCTAEPVVEGIPPARENRREVIREVKRKREVLRKKLKGKKAVRLIAR